MKTVVSLQELLEVDVRPAGLLAEYVALTKADISQRWGSRASELAGVDCQGCGATERTTAFTKYGLTYCQCVACQSLYVSPRPSAEAIEAFYRESSAIRYWREHILPATSEARAEKIARPRAQWVADGIAEYCADAGVACDLSPAGSTLGQELLGIVPGQLPRAMYTLDELGVDGAPGVVVHQATAPGIVDVVTAFDVLDRCYSGPALAASIAAALRPNGLLFATATSISGFDLQVLWDRSATLTPPDKLQALSMAGLRQLFAPPTWELIELSTPGMLDAENVRRAIRNAPDADWPRVITSLVSNLDEQGWTDLQGFLQEHRLASFARLVARRLG